MGFRLPRPPPLRTDMAADFSGGPNLRDAQSELANNESLDGWNITFDERGGVGARLGSVQYNATAFTGAGVAAVSNVHYSALLASVVTQAGTNLYLGTTNTVRKTFTTPARVGFADFETHLYCIHPVDGMFSTTDGITWTILADADAPKGTCLAVWQNKLWAAGNPTNKARVTWSAAGDGLTWAPTDFVDLREKDSDQVVALAGSSGVDIIGRAGLLAFKQRSSYRIGDSGTGAYQTIDTKVGAASAIAAVSWNGRVYTISEYGIYSTSGVSEMRNESGRFEPLWTSAQINVTNLDLFCAGMRGRDRLHFSLCRAGSSANDLSLELHTQQGWLAPGSNVASAYAFATNVGKLYAGSPTVTGRVYELYAAVGTDDGVAITSRFQTRWFEPAGGYEAQMWKARLKGRGSFTFTVLTDYQQSGGTGTATMISSGTQLLYDTALMYDTGLTYSAAFVQGIADILTPGLARAFSFRIDAVTTDVQTDPVLLGAGSGPAAGSWSLYGIEMSSDSFQPL